ncbi:hypothetical protein ACNHKD_04465 [Methylocystis sp. JAN1]|uniref:hypothetical protein n=1 Tax=Methylocystis sp. JAN1 TaxID=3397211 RepID=UPI003FA2FCD7
MQISLEEAIEIHAKALRKRHRDQAPVIARRHAEMLKYAKDFEGCEVWLRVAGVASGLADEDLAEQFEESRRSPPRT